MFNIFLINVTDTKAQKEEKRQFKVYKTSKKKINVKEVSMKFSLDYLTLFKCEILSYFTALYLLFCLIFYFFTFFLN